MNEIEYLNVTRNKNHYTFSYYFVDYDFTIIDRYELGIIAPTKEYNGHSLCLIPQKNLFKCDSLLLPLGSRSQQYNHRSVF